MSAPATARPPVLRAPRLRFARMLWRVLPMLVVVGLVLLGAWLFDAPAAAVGQLGIAGGVLILYGLLRALITEIFSPDRPQLRLVPVSDGRARRLAATLRGLLFFLLVTGLGIALVDLNGWHRGVADVLRVVRNLVLVLSAALLLSSSSLVDRLRKAQGESWRGVTLRFAGKVVFPLAVFTLLFTVVARGLGYAPLANWVAENAGWSILKVAAAALFYRWARRALFRTIRFYREDRPVEGVEGEAPSIETDTVALGLQRIGGALVKVLVLVVSVFWVLSGWSVTPQVVLHAFEAPIVGDEGTTWGQLVGGILTVVAVFVAGWFVRTVLTYFVFPRSKVGVGGRYAILAILRYVVIALAIVFALDVLGVNTSSLGWFFGAAGIGIGLGLQDIIGNFISGLIMLIERPIRVGDNVRVGDAAGTVENIHMRGTILRTFDKTTVLIPNSQMLTERVTNLSYGMEFARVMVNVGVSYDSDPAQVQELLLHVAQEHPRVVDEPAPFVWFQEFGASSLDFTLVSFTAEITSRNGVASDLRHVVFDRLRKAGIEIPFPQQDLHIRSGLPEGPVA